MTPTHLVELLETVDLLEIPYAPSRDRDTGEMIDHGFFDLKAHPDLVEAVPELRGALELWSLVTALNSPSSPLMSLGCGLAAGKPALALGPEVSAQFVSSVNIAFADLRRNSDEELIDVARKVDDLLHEAQI